MSRDDIILMAQQANRYASNQTGDSYEWHFIRDERFAALVAAAEREACAGLAERRLLDDDNADRRVGHHHACKSIAADIRARSTNEL